MKRILNSFKHLSWTYSVPGSMPNIMMTKLCWMKNTIFQKKKNALSFHIFPSFAFQNVSWLTRSPLSTAGYFMPLLSEQMTKKTIMCYEQVASQLPSIISWWPSSQPETQRIEQQWYKLDGLSRTVFQVGSETWWTSDAVSNSRTPRT